MTRPDDEARLVAAAAEVRGRAICPFSRFAVGCAMLDDQGRIWTGANVENASYTLGLCAERVAIFHALTHGGRGFTAAAIVTAAKSPTSPCGACRQILYEYARDAELILVTTDGQTLRTRVRDLLPHGFDAGCLDP